MDGPQRASWAPGIKEAMDLRGQKVEMVVKPTTSLYAPFYQGKMMEEARSKGYNLAGQERPGNGNNYPMVDLTNPLHSPFVDARIAQPRTASLA